MKTAVPVLYHALPMMTSTRFFFSKIPCSCEPLSEAKESLMAEHQIRFDDGAAYERMMGAWSRLAGGIFLDWIVPRPGLRWVNVGRGNGAPSPNWSSKGAHQPRFTGSTRPRGSSSTRGHGLGRAWQSSAKATLWRFPLRTTVLI